MDIAETIGRELASFFIGPKGISVLLLVGLLIYIRKYLAAAFFFISIAYIVGLTTLGRALTLDAFPMNMFLIYLGAGLLLVGSMGYLLFIRQPVTRSRNISVEQDSEVVPDKNNFRIFPNKGDSSVFMHS